MFIAILATKMMKGKLSIGETGIRTVDKPGMRCGYT